jgi:aspartate ammonia-lyase
MARQPSNLASCRIERDALGERAVPADALYGVHTVRAAENFGLSGDRLSDRPALIAALGQVKRAAARANGDLEVVEGRAASAIAAAATELVGGQFHDQFPVTIVQGGGGTSANMNVNEVLANRANAILGEPLGQYRPVHPIAHVNRSQSTNDVVPTALGIAVFVTTRQTCAGLDRVKGELLKQAELYEGVERLGRTCLRDAVPVSITALHRAQAHAVARAARDLERTAERLLAVPLGGTAAGTGLGAPDGFRELAIGYLRDGTHLPIRPAEDMFAALASLESFAAVADEMARSGRVLARIAADLRLLASGPVGGIGEVCLSPLQVGSSIMPGKFNPVLPELVMQVGFQLSGAAHVTHLAAGAGELDLAVMGPVVAAELLAGLEKLGTVAALFADLCISGLSWDLERVEANLRGSLGPAVEYVAVNGYEDGSGG